MKVLIRCTFFCFLALLTNCCQGQGNLVSKLLAYKKILDKNSIEKIHVHTNQPYYLSGDTVWFKAYIIDANLNRPSTASNTLNIELTSLKSKLVTQIKTKIVVGLSNGYFSLPDTLKSGSYILRAYTNTMARFGNDFFYQKTLIVKGEPEAINSEVMSGNLDLAFFPEGGELVQGLKSKVGFKALGEDGLGVTVKGIIQDDLGNSLCNINSEHLGMGEFEFTPQPGRVYSVHVIDSTNRKSYFQLPLAKESGYVLSAYVDTDSVKLDIKYSKGLSHGSTTIIGSQDGVTRYISKVKKIPSGLHLSIPKVQFYTGVIQFTVFDDIDVPVAERLLFCNHKDFLKINVGMEAQYQKHESVKLLLDLHDVDDRSDIGSLDVSVYGESEFPDDENTEQTIFSDLLLTTDLRGFVEQPNSYFVSSNNTVAERNLDILLLTQGWRKFSWKNKLSISTPDVKEEEVENKISGDIKLPSGAPFINGEVTLIQKGLEMNVVHTKTDSLGIFIFKDLNIRDTTNFLISGNGKNLKIKVFDTTVPVIHLFTPAEQNRYLVPKRLSTFNSSNTEQEHSKLKSISLDQVKITGKKPGIVIESVNLNGAGKADAVILEEDLRTTQDLSTYLLNNVTGLKTFEGKIYSRDIPELGRQLASPPPMLIILDGTSLNQENYSVSDIDASNVQSIEVLKGASAAMYGINGMGGVLVITSKKGRDHSRENLGKKSNGLLSFTKIGYQKERNFYVPKYTPVNNQRDLRKALYWNPQVITLADKKVELQFFNPDYKGKFKVVVEGINGDGQIGRAVYSYEVK